MLLHVLVLAATLQDAPQTPQQQPDAVTSAPLPASAQPSIDAGLALFRKRSFRAARIEFEKGIAADPQSAAAHFYLGYTLYKIGEPTLRLVPEKVQAAEEFAKCYELDPHFAPVWRGHGR